MEDRTQLVWVADQNQFLATVQDGNENVKIFDLGCFVYDDVCEFVVAKALVSGRQDGGANNVGLGQDEVLNRLP